MSGRLRRGAALVVALLVLVSGSASSGVVPAAAQVVRPWQQAEQARLSPALVPFLDGLAEPVFVGHAGDGSGRLFVVERRGKIKVVEDGRVLPTPFLDITNDVASTSGEQGLLGLAFHPNFEVNGRFYVYFTPPPPSPAPNNAVVLDALAEYRVTAPGGDVADPGTRRVLFALPDRFANHNGGMLAFGPDGYLYVAIGDEGGGGDPFNNAESLGTLFGKVLRLDVDRTDPGLPYAIPPNNPFVGRTDARAEIWAYGLRNPWRMSFDRTAGDLWIADVGQNAYEEVNRQPAGSAGGQHYGWNTMEGLHCFGPGSCDQAGLTLPVAEYDRRGTGDCSVTGGYVYRGPSYPELTGAYVYGDFCSGRIWTLRRQGSGWMSTLAIDSPYRITSFGEDERGELYVVDAGGRIFRLIDSSVSPVECIPRPRVDVRATRAGSDELLVRVAATTNQTGRPNTLRSIELGEARNATVLIGGAARPNGFTQLLAGGTTELTFTVRRAGAGAMHVPFTATDGCGAWPSFVGAGTGP